MNEQNTPKGPKYLKASVKSIIQEHAIRNLILAQKCAALKGDAKGALRIAKYLMRISEDFKNVAIEVEP